MGFPAQEVAMKKCLAIAVLLLASSLSTAQAQYSFEYGGRTITIDPDRGTVSIPDVYDNTGKEAKRPRGEEGDLDRPGKKAPQQAKSAPQAAPEAAAPAAPAPAEQAAAPAASTLPPANSPLGVWLTEEKEGKVRIEPCGPNICGYSVDKKSNQNGEQVLINMKPGKDKWSGRILDLTTGSTYDSTIALKGSDTLRVQGCAFGGMFCGGQTWTRVN